MMLYDANNYNGKIQEKLFVHSAKIFVCAGSRLCNPRCHALAEELDLKSKFGALATLSRALHWEAE